MGLFRRPALWAVALAGAFALTIGGRPTVTMGPYWLDNPQADTLALDDAGELGAAILDADVGVVDVDDASDQATLAFAPVGGGEEAPMAVGGPTESEADETFGEEPKALIFVHVVAPGETLSTIASRYGINQETILAANDLPSADRLQIGEKLKILSIDGALHTVKRGESLWEIARAYRADMNQIVEANAIANPDALWPSQELLIPGREAASIGSSLRSDRLVSSDGRLLKAFSWPLRGPISSGYGPRWGRIHHGIDLAVNTGTPVSASASGRVSFAGTNGGYGILVVIDHGNGVETRYAHLSRLVVKAGQYVRRGELIAYSGNTGNSTGPHLHFEIRLRGNSVNPINYLR